jgi:hypothetical protein
MQNDERLFDLSLALFATHLLADPQQFLTPVSRLFLLLQ